jgi:predicted glycosyltransferase
MQMENCIIYTLYNSPKTKPTEEDHLNRSGVLLLTAVGGGGAGRNIQHSTPNVEGKTPGLPRKGAKGRLEQTGIKRIQRKVAKTPGVKIWTGFTE